MLNSATHATDPAFLAAAAALTIALLPAMAPGLQRRQRVTVVLRWLLGSRRRP